MLLSFFLRDTLDHSIVFMKRKYSSSSDDSVRISIDPVDHARRLGKVLQAVPDKEAIIMELHRHMTCIGESKVPSSFLARARVNTAFNLLVLTSKGVLESEEPNSL